MVEGQARIAWGRKPRKAGWWTADDGQGLASLYWESPGRCEPLTPAHIDQHRDRLWQLVSKRDLTVLQAAFPECFKEER